MRINLDPHMIYWCNFLMPPQVNWLQLYEINCVLTRAWREQRSAGWLTQPYGASSHKGDLFIQLLHFFGEGNWDFFSIQTVFVNKVIFVKNSPAFLPRHPVAVVAATVLWNVWDIHDHPQKWHSLCLQVKCYWLNSIYYRLTLISIKMSRTTWLFDIKLRKSLWFNKNIIGSTSI